MKHLCGNTLTIIMCFSFFWLCGCPYSPEVSRARRYVALGNAPESAQDEIRVRCSQSAAKEMIEIIARKNMIPSESNRRFEKTIKHFLMDDVISKKDQVLVFAWYEGSGSFPEWGHLLIVKSVVGTDLTLIRVIRQEMHHVKHRSDSKYFFDWIAMIRTESEIKGYSVL